MVYVSLKTGAAMALTVASWIGVPNAEPTLQYGVALPSMMTLAGSGLKLAATVLLPFMVMLPGLLVLM
jgi:hypothetical protein